MRNHPRGSATSWSDTALVQELGEEPTQLTVAALAEQVGQALLDVIDGGGAGGDAGVPLLGQCDQFGPPVGRVGAADEVAHSFELVDELAHRLRGHVRALGQVGEPRTVRRDLPEYRGVGRLLRESGPDYAVDYLEPEEAVGAAQEGNGIDAFWSLWHIAQDT